MNETVFDVFLACPDDAVNARAVVEKAIKDWNAKHRYSENVHFRTRHYRKHAVPILGRGDGQSVTNAQLVDSAQIIFGVFHRNLGTPTARAPSGSAEEIELAFKLNKIIHVYFGEQPVGVASEGVDSGLLEFRKKVQGRGLAGTYESPASLRKLIMRALDYDVSELRLRDATAGAWLQPVRVSGTGSSAILVGYHRQLGRIEVRNAGKHGIEDVSLGATVSANLPVFPIAGAMKRGFLEPFASIHFDVDQGILGRSDYVPFEVSYEDHGEVQRYEYILTSFVGR